MGWLREFFRPALKCARTGEHINRVEEREYYTDDTEGYRSVADRVTEERTACRRCGAVSEDWHETDRDGIQSLSMPDSMWKTMRKDGRVYL